MPHEDRTFCFLLGNSALYGSPPRAIIPCTSAGDAPTDTDWGRSGEQTLPSFCILVAMAICSSLLESFGEHRGSENNKEKREDLAHCDSRQVGSLTKQEGEVGFFWLCPCRSHSWPATAWLLVAGYHEPGAAELLQRHHCWDLAQKSDHKKQPILKGFFPQVFYRRRRNQEYQ